MRILIISDTTGHMRGGVPAASRRLIEGLRRRGHEVGFLGDIPLSNDPSIRFFAWNVFDVSVLTATLAAAIESFEPDVVHVISMSSRGLVVAVPLLAARRWVLTCHSIPPYERKVGRFHDSEALHYAFRWLRFLPNSLAWRFLFLRGRMPHVIVHSDWVAAIVRRYGFPAARTTVIALGNEPDIDAASPTIAKRAGPPRVVTVGGVAHTKGQHDAIAAIAGLRDAFPGIEYRMIGETRDPSYLAWLESLIERAGLGSQVQVLSTLSQADKARELAAADLYLQPSHEEGFCLAFLEAAACVPRLVATDAGAMRRICGNDAATRVVPVRAPGAMAAAMGTLLGTSALPEALAVRRTRLDREFGWQQYTEAHERLYATLGPRARPADALAVVTPRKNDLV